jgi:hypothetical protein
MGKAALTLAGKPYNRQIFGRTHMQYRMMLSILLILSSTASAQKAKPIELAALDYFQIQQLVAKYARAIDTCSNNGYDYAGLFTHDGYFAPSMNGKAGPRFQGREQLAEVSGGGANGCKNVPWILEGIHHIYVNHVITPTAEGAAGTVDMLMIGLGGDPNKMEYDGYYEDVYVRTSQGWRFKSRIHHALLNQGKRVAPTPKTR